ncbi:MAG TPA: FAD:protein FMN transferase [Povalibacter sp.]|uniref:FAD:protein FMN transferase n=1 Tax=Povalibacter sp. TaxID=1962978 RepID=UPI002BA06BDA|nr:FAD:protein FMN transferase [Povalibacter sp.]HMN43727.1 FAD:protein FMN transferase [Povalibacter sp.]
MRYPCPVNTRTYVSLALLLLTACTPAPDLIELAGPAQGTTYSIKIVDPPRGIDRQSLQSVVDEVFANVDRQMSGYREDSELSRFNRSSSTDWFDVSPDVVKVVAAAAQVSDLSQGALDITVAPLVNLWGMGAGGELRDVPDTQRIEQARQDVGYRRLAVRNAPAALRKELPQLTVDLNAVAPGYTVDLIAQRFAAMGVTNFMIDVGGEVRARGRNARNELWRIAVERPVDDEPEPYAIVQLDDIAVTTSGEYRHYVMRDGHRYSHTIDPRTGRPVEHRLASVVVIMPTAIEADAWTTALNVLGEEAGYALAQRQRIPAMFIVANGAGFEHRMTAGFERFLAVAPR